jgi:hypothetical protein
MSDLRKNQIQNFLLDMLAEYQRIEAERQWLVNNAQARVTEIQGLKAELRTEAQEQLDKLNILRAADNEPALTLAQLTQIASVRRGKRLPTPR